MYRKSLWCLFLMTIIFIFSLWRREMTVIRPLKERYYIFAKNNYLGQYDNEYLNGLLYWLERCWGNDFIYLIGMIGGLYICYTLIQFIIEKTESNFSNIFKGQPEYSEERFEEEKRKFKSVMFAGLGIAFILAVAEEIHNIVPGYIFDKWDLFVIGNFSTITAIRIAENLTHPIFSEIKYKHIKKDFGNLILKYCMDINTIIWTGLFTWFQEPKTISESWWHIFDMSIMTAVAMHISNRISKIKKIESLENLS